VDSCNIKVSDIAQQYSVLKVRCALDLFISLGQNANMGFVDAL